jgi:hypothetical protein
VCFCGSCVVFYCFSLKDDDDDSKMDLQQIGWG